MYHSPANLITLIFQSKNGFAMLRIHLLNGTFFLMISSFSSFAQEPWHIIPFQLASKLIHVQAVVDGQNGVFIFDTGIPGLILNNKYYKGIRSSQTITNIYDQKIHTETKEVQLQLGVLNQKTEAQITNLQTLEQATGFSIHGLLGVNLFKKNEIVINFFNKEIHLYALDKKGDRLVNKDPYLMPGERCKFRMKGHLPYIVGKICGRKLILALDTGATVNLLYPTLKKKFKSCLMNIRQRNLVGIGQRSQTVTGAIVSLMQIGALECTNMETYFYLPGELNYSLDGGFLNGILGYEFLHQFRTAINFHKREIYLWDKTALELEMLVTKN